MIETLTDWRGNEYTIGDTILYPRASGRSVEMQEATVLEIRPVIRDHDSYTWRKAKPGEEHEAIRVKVQPTRLGSRGFYRTTDKTVYLDENDNPTTYENAAPDGPVRHSQFGSSWQPRKSRREEVPFKAVTILDIQNITKI